MNGARRSAFRTSIKEAVKKGTILEQRPTFRCAFESMRYRQRIGDANGLNDETQYWPLPRTPEQFGRLS
jgi:hypothetical protein